MVSDDAQRVKKIVRLLQYYLDNYGRDRQVTDLVANNELWFIHVLVYAGIGCEVEPTTGTWNSFTGSSNGWQEAAFDLTP